MALKQSMATLTRPANTTTYTAGDVVSNDAATGVALVFAGVVRGTNGNGSVALATLVDSANQTLKGDFELWLFNTAPVAVNDNLPLAITDIALGALVTVIKFPVAGALVSNLGVGADGNVTYFGVPASGAPDAVIFTKKTSRDLFGVVVVRNAYVPIASSTLRFTLSIE